MSISIEDYYFKLEYGPKLRQGNTFIMSKRGKVADGIAPQAPSVASWTISDLASIYAEQRSSLIAQAYRILRIEADAQEVVQEAFLKFILAAPELDSADRALAYLRTTVNNISFNNLRAKKARGENVALEIEVAQADLEELAMTTYVPFDETIIAAEDAAIIREALSRLSPDQRTAIVMWDIEGRSTEEIAKTLETTPENVRHIVSRGRSSFVRVLTNWVINEETGTTALQALSLSYKKAVKFTSKPTTAAMSLVLIFALVFGLNLSSETRSTVISNIKPVLTPNTLIVKQPVAQDMLPLIRTIIPTPARKNSTNLITATPDPKLNMFTQVAYAKMSRITYAGINPNGIPSGFTATDLSGDTGHVIMGNPTPIVTLDGFSLTAPVMSFDPKAINVLLNQVISVTGLGTTYTATPSISMHGGWVALNVSAVSTNIERLADGNYLVSSIMITTTPVDASISLPVSQGIDARQLPTSISTLVLLNSGKSQILAESIKVNANGVLK